MKSLLLLLFLYSTALVAQQLNLNSSVVWDGDSSIVLKSRGTNFKAPFLVNLKVHSTESKEQKMLLQEDSLLIKKGIFQLQQTISRSQLFTEEEHFPLELELTFTAVTDGRVISSSKVSIEKPQEAPPTLDIGDTALSIIYSGNKTHGLTLELSDSVAEKTIAFDLKQDTILYARQLIAERPFLKKEMTLSITNEEGKKVLEQKLHYELGRFYAHQPQNRLKELLEEKQKEKPFDISGSFYVENNAFSAVPEHSNGLQYPNTIFRAENTVSLYGIPFQLTGSHTTNDNIDPNFRNFFSFSLDVSDYRAQVINQLQEEALAKEYPIGKIDQDLDFNRAAIQRLEQMKSSLQQYPEQQFELDEMLEKEQKRLLASERMDSLALSKESLNADASQLEIPEVDPAKLESPELEPSTAAIDSLAPLDADTSEYAKKIKKIDRYIKRYEASNRYKEKLKKQKLEQPDINPANALHFNDNELFQQYAGSGIGSVLLRFQKLQLGNFYEYAGKYSISDVEMIGVNAEILVNPENSVGVLRAKVNNFQSFNLDDVEGNIHLSSAAVKNTELSYFSPSLRITQFKDKSIDSENPNLSASYFVTSLSATGEVGSFLYYEGEVNRSDEGFEETVSNSDNLIQDMAIYGKIEVNPFDFLALNVKYDRIGSNYQSDGVYFLTRNLQSYSLGSHWRFFKNKIYFKNDYTFINRNFEEDELKNNSEKFFYELGSRFKRIPNFQLIYTPITVDIANNLDSSFSKLNAYSAATIARVYYIKRVKKTIFNTALIYSEIDSDFLDNSSHTQRGFQHYMAVNNEVFNFSFTSSYNEVFEEVRFVAANFAYQLKENLLASLYVAKNFQDDRYSEILRMRFDVQLKKYLLIGAGSSLLLERGQNPNYGSTVGVKLIY